MAVKRNPHPCLLKEELKGRKVATDKCRSRGASQAVRKSLLSWETRRYGSDFPPNFPGHSIRTRVDSLLHSLVFSLGILSSSEISLFLLDPSISSHENWAINGCMFISGRSRLIQNLLNWSVLSQKHHARYLMNLSTHTEIQSSLHIPVHLPASCSVCGRHFQESLHKSEQGKNEQMKKQNLFHEKPLRLGILVHINLLRTKYYVLLFIKCGHE